MVSTARWWTRASRALTNYPSGEELVGEAFVGESAREVGLVEGDDDASGMGGEEVWRGGCSADTVSGSGAQATGPSDADSPDSDPGTGFVDDDPGDGGCANSGPT